MESPEECARQVLETVPIVMRAIRREMRSHRESELSVPRLRVLIYLNRNEGASLSDVAEYLGLTLPAASKLVGCLVDRSLVIREIHSGDRRFVTLAPTERGRTVMRKVSAAARERLAERLGFLSESEKTIVIQAMRTLASIFSVEQKAKIGTEE